MSDFYELVGKDRPEYGNMQRPVAAARPQGQLGPTGYVAQAQSQVSCWAQADNCFYGIASSHPTIPPGIYRCEVRDMIGFVLVRQEIRTDNLIHLPDSETESILDDIAKFRQRADRFRALGFLHKRGVLLWGPAGSGKTSTVMQLCELIVGREDGVAVYAGHPEVTARCLQLLRRIEPDRPVVVIYEDLDALVDSFGENEYLSLLDGESQVDNVVNVATTNYPERLDRRFVDRPGRFALIKYVGMPSHAARAAYVTSKLPDLDARTLAAYVHASDGLSIDHLREIIVLTQCDDVTLEAAEERMRAMKHQKPSSEKEPGRQGPGFAQPGRSTMAFENGNGGIIDRFELPV